MSKRCALPRIKKRQTAVVAAPQSRSYELVNSEQQIVEQENTPLSPLTPHPPEQPPTDQKSAGEARKRGRETEEVKEDEEDDKKEGVVKEDNEEEDNIEQFLTEGVTEENLSKALEIVENIVIGLRCVDTIKLVEDAPSFKNKFETIQSFTLIEVVPNQTHRQLIAQKYIGSQLPQLMSDMWREIKRRFHELKTSYPPSTTLADLWRLYLSDHPYLLVALSNFSKCQAFIWNGTDLREPKQLLDDLYYSGIELLLNLLGSEDVLPLKDVYAGVPFHVVKAALVTLGNFCHNSEWHIPDMRNRGTLLMLKRFVSLDPTDEPTFAYLKISAVISSTYLQTEQDNKDDLSLDTKAIEYLVEQMRVTLETAQDDGASYETGYRVDELLNGLNNIASIEPNKIRLIKANVLPLYVRAMESDLAALQLGGVRGVMSLSFDKEAQQWIQQDTDCMAGLWLLSQYAGGAIENEAKGALWKIGGKLENFNTVTPKSDGVRMHIMLSYQWDVQKEVLKLREQLKQAGFRVWIDVEQMCGSTLEAMAQAVLNTVCFVPVLTEKYKKSNACRLEAENAHKLQKKIVPVRLQTKYRPDGWLGFMLGSTFFYDLTKPNEYESKLQDLLKAIGDAGKILPGEDETVMPFQPELMDIPDAASLPIVQSPPQQQSVAAAVSVSDTQQVFGSSSPSSTFKPTKLKCYSWTETEVSDWMERESLGSFQSLFGGIDGRQLVELVVLQLTAPDALLRSDLRIALKDILRLNAALRELVPDI